ncbi:MAG: ParB/RepB/Spo0J family partition protein [Oscillospiraceae bacterium]|nr:ParB/RepB/Spo0J family partition protein [Oscillospiraceae bacterium]
MAKTGKGLGTGLGALFGDAAVEDAPNDFIYLPLRMIEPRPDQPRSVFEQDRIDELTESIREHGIMSPLTVRSISDGYYQIVAGERRWRAARDAGLDEVPVRIVVADDTKATELALVENLQREDLNPIEEARGFKSLMDASNMTQEEVAQRVSKSRSAVANSLRLLTLPEQLIKLVENNDLAVGSARALLAIKNDVDIISAAQLIIKNDLNVREVESLVKKMNNDSAGHQKQAGDDVDYFSEARERLEIALGRRVAIKHGNGRGKIELEYYSIDDFDVLYGELSSIH